MKAIRIDPKFALARLKLTEVLIWQSDYSDAREQIESIKGIIEKLTFTEKLRFQSLEARINGDRIKEQNSLQQLVELLPYKRYRYDFGESYFNYAEASGAIKHYKDALEIDPKYALALNHLGLCYSWLGEHAAAEKQLAAYVAIDKSINSYDSLASGYMFAGRYADAIKACRQGLALNSDEGLYGNLASNLLLFGRLREAAENWTKQISLTVSESTKANAKFYLALNDYLRGQPENARRTLAEAKEFYSSPSYTLDVSDSACLPFWLEGVMDYNDKNIKGLEACMVILEDKIKRGNVSENNYSPVLKFYQHLKALGAGLKSDRAKLIEAVESGVSIKDKLGYWTSIFNLSYMFNEYVSLLLVSGDLERARALIDQALSYNPNDPRSYLNQAYIAARSGDKAGANVAIQKAAKLLNGADQDFVLFRQLNELKELTR